MKRLLSIVLTLVMLIGMVPMSTYVVSAAEETEVIEDYLWNTADYSASLGKTVTSNASYNEATYPVSNLTNGGIGGFWVMSTPPEGEEAYVEVDFGSVRAVRAMRVALRDGLVCVPNSIEYSYFYDGQWESLGKVTTAGATSQWAGALVLPEDVETQKIRLTFPDGDDGSGICLAEIQVLDPTTRTVENHHWPVIALSSGSTNGATVDAASWEVTSWVANIANTIKIDFSDVNTGNVSTVTVDGQPYTSGDDIVITEAGDIEVVVRTARLNWFDCVRKFTIQVGAADVLRAPEATVTFATGSLNGANVDSEAWAVQNWVKGSADTIKVNVEQPDLQAISTVTINGQEYVAGSDYTITKAGDLNVVVTTTKYGCEDRVQEFTVMVGEQGSVNLALGGISDFYDKGGTILGYAVDSLPTYATDGKMETGLGGPPYVYNYDYYLTMKSAYTNVNEIRLFFTESALAVPDQYKVYVSPYLTGETWFEVEHVEQSENNPVNIITFPPRKVARVKLENLGVREVIGLREVEVHSNPNYVDDTERNNLIDANASAKIYLADETARELLDVVDPNNVLDADPNTVATTNYDAKWMLEVDLGEVKEKVNEIEVTFSGDDTVPSRYHVQTSEDGILWKTQATFETETTKNATQLIRFYPADTRYVRVRDMSSDEGTMEISGIEVYATGIYHTLDTPIITDIYPLRRETDVAKDQNVIVVFSQPLADISNIPQGLFWKHEESFQDQGAVYSLDESKTVVTMDLNGDFKAEALQLITVKHEILGVEKYVDHKFTSFLRLPELSGEITDKIVVESARYYDTNTFETLSEDKERFASYALDGDKTTVAVAQTPNGNNNWGIELELDDVYEGVNKLKLAFGSTIMTVRPTADEVNDNVNTNTNFKPTEVKVYTSVDGVNWYKATTEYFNKNVQVIEFVQRRAKFIRIESANSPSATNIMGIGEINVYRTDDVVTVPLRFVEASPYSGQQAVALDEKVMVQFNKPVDPDLLKQAVKIINAASDKEIDYTFTTNDTDAGYILTPVENLQGSTTYKVTLDKDLLGLVYAVADITFTTEADWSNEGNLASPDDTVKLFAPNSTVELKWPSYDSSNPINAAMYKPANAVDGDYNTATVAAGSYQYTLQLDLGEVYTKVNQVKVHFVSNATTDGVPKNYSVSVSEDGAKWTTVATVNSTVADKESRGGFVFDPSAVRYVRVADLDSANYNINGGRIQMQVAEIEVYRNENAKEPNLIIESVTPASGKAGVLLDANVEVKFNKPLASVDVVKDNIVFKSKPGKYIDATYSFKDDSNKTVVIDPIEDFINENTYIIDFDCEAIGCDEFDNVEFTTVIRDSQRENIAIGAEAYLLLPGSQPKFDKNLMFTEGGRILPPSGTSVAANGVDGRRDTFSAGAQSYTWTYHVDLGQTYSDVDEIRVYFKNEGADGTPVQYDVEVSADGETFENIKSVAHTSAATKNHYPKFTFEPRDVRCIRVTSKVYTEYDIYGNRIQMQIGELEVFQRSDNAPLEEKIFPEKGMTEVDITESVDFSFNRPLNEGEYFATIVDADGNPVNSVMNSNADRTKISVLPEGMYETNTTYTVTLKSTDGATDEFEYTTTFTTGDSEPEFKITTKSTAAYMTDKDNSIYPAFVDNFRYQHWTLDGALDYYQLQAVGGSGELVWKITSGRLPTGLTLTEDGKIVGEATVEEETSFSVMVTDRLGRTAKKTLTMEARPYRAKWHEEAKFGVMIQWGTISTPYIEYKEDIYKFEERCVNFNAEEWAQNVYDLGGRSFNFTVVAGDGVRLWPSTTSSVSDLHTERNYVKELIDACHKRGIKFIAYVPGAFHWRRGTMEDWSPIDGTESTLQYGLIQELIAMGVDGFWFDSDAGVGAKSYFNWEEIGPMIKYENPDVIVGSNPHGDRATFAINYPYTDYIIHEGGWGGQNYVLEQYGSWSPTTKKLGSEYDAMMQTAWADDGTDNTYTTFRNVDLVIQNIKDNWANGVNYMVNFMTLTDGTFASDLAMERLKEIGAWVNSHRDDGSLWGWNINRKVVELVDDKEQENTAFLSQTGQTQDLIAEIVQGSPDNYDNYPGIKFIAPPQETIVTQLGRYYVPGNTGEHRIRIVRRGDEKLEYLRQVEIDFSDPSTYTLDEDGFAYADVEPLKLEPGWIYYVLSSEDNYDEYAKPDITKMWNNYGVLVSSPAWTDLSGTRMYDDYGPSEYEFYRPYMPYPDGSEGGGLTNFKAVVRGKTNSESNLSANSIATLHLSNSLDVVTSSSGITWPQWAVDGNSNTSTIAGDDQWEYAVHVDLGEVKKQINQVTIEFGYYATQYEILVSNDGENFRKIYHGINNATSTTAKFDPVDARFIRVRYIKPNSTVMNVPGVAVSTKEIKVYTTNMALGGSASFIPYSGKGTELSLRDNLSYAVNAIDHNSMTTATANAKSSALKVLLPGWRDIEKIVIDGTNSGYEVLTSMDGKTWEALDAGNIASQTADTIEFTEPVVMKHMLVRALDSEEILQINDVATYGKVTVNPPVEQEPEPEQPPVGGGGGGSSSSDSSSTGTSTPAPEVVAPTVKPGWAQDANGDWTYGAEDGKATIGWAKIHGIWYHFDNNGIMQTGWYKDTDGKWYFFDNNGAMTTGWVHDGNAWYYMNSSGAMMTGWVMVNSKWYYLDGSGAMVTGWRQVGASWYYFMPNGAMVTGWNLIGGKWYFMHNTGSMAFNQWIYSNGKWYYVTSDGSMAVNTVIDGYKVDENGVWVK